MLLGGLLDVSGRAAAEVAVASGAGQRAGAAGVGQLAAVLSGLRARLLAQNGTSQRIWGRHVRATNPLYVLRTASARAVTNAAADRGDNAPLREALKLLQRPVSYHSTCPHAVGQPTPRAVKT